MYKNNGRNLLLDLIIMSTASNNMIMVCKVNELLPGQSKCIEGNGKAIAIFNIKGKYYAIDNACIHAGGSLCDSPVDEENAVISCGWHGWGFDLATGKCVTHPKQDVFTGTYPVKIQGDEIFIVT